MATESIQTQLKEFATHSKELGDTALKLTRVKATRKTANISAHLIFTILSSALSVIMLLFLSVAAALWLGDVFHSGAMGFLLIGGFYFILIVAVILMKKSLFLPWLRNKIVQKIYE